MASPGFKDHFSGNSADYASYRPGYPSGLFAWLAAQVPARDLAWDCATGSGQAALGLVPHFHQEVRRVLKPEGALALWCYERLQIEPALDALIEDFYARLLGPYWPPERRHVETGYQELAFPFREVAAPVFAMEAAWALDPLMGYFATWSAVKAYRRATGNDPLPALRARLAQAWEASGVSLATPKTIKWPLSVRFGRL